MGKDLYDSVVSKIALITPMFAKAIVDMGLEKLGANPYEVTPSQMRIIINEEVLPKLKKFIRNDETLETIGGGKISFDSNGKIISLNTSAKKFLLLKGKDLSDDNKIYQVLDEMGLKEIVDSVLNQEQEVTVKEVELEESKVRLNVIAGSLKDNQNKILGATLFIQDITLKSAIELEVDQVYKRIESQNKELLIAKNQITVAKEFSDNIINSMIDSLIIVNPEGIIEKVNKATLNLLGYREDEIIGKHIEIVFRVTQKEEKSDFLLFASSLLGKEKIKELNINRFINNFEINYFSKIGDIIPMMLSISVIKGNNGNIVLMAKDMSEIKHAEQEIQQNYDIQYVLNTLLKLQVENVSLNKILEKTLDSILDIPWLSFESKGAIFITEEPSILVMKAQKNVGEPICLACSKINFGKCLCGLAALKKEIQFTDCLDERHTTRYENMVKHGHYCVPITFMDKVLGVINIYIKAGSSRNVEAERFLNSIANVLASIINRKYMEQEKEKLQAQFLQIEKMAAVGQLAGGVAHEINNPMGVILGFAQSVVKNIKEGDLLYMPLKSIEREAVRCKNLINDLLVFSRKEKSKVELVNINIVIDGTISLIEAQAKLKKVEIIKKYSEGLPMIMVNSNQIQQVIVNLCNNAMDAMPKGGEIKISSNIEIDNRYINYIIIRISDTGEGIPNEIKSKIFEPYFTTKEVGKGTGLGLSLSYEIIQKHNGTIEVESPAFASATTPLADNKATEGKEIGKGTTFIIKLPVGVDNYEN
ncbi:MAG: hypothetical protein A2539_09450 [Elusimicrobia bacterium RIFOXYD2_FULL_34_15]|nr:MAG: hypothetical protein A2539_09450 [Elusimicrobia bacterium RIFOXYD2_FULL_34_15]